MRNINNKYLIECELNSEENFLNYLVLDLKENKKYILCVLKNDFTYEKTRDYLLSKFKTFKNLNFKCVVNIIRIEIIHSMNGIKLDKPQYGYLIEYIHSKIDTQVYLKKCTLNEKLDIFMKLCTAVNTLNMKGYIFDDILLKDIVLFRNKNKTVSVKIRKMLQNELGKFNMLNSSVNSPLYQYNYEEGGDTNSKKDNIVQVIDIFNQIFSDEEIESQLKELKDVKKLYNQVNTINKSFKLKYFIRDVNEKMHKNYNIFEKDALNSLTTDLDIIGREEEIKIVEKNFQKILESKEKYKIIAFNGEEGSGKSRILEEIKYRIKNKYFKDYIYIDDFESSSVNKEEKYNKLLTSILKKADRNLKEKYEIYIRKFISMIIKKDSSDYENKQKLKLVNRIGKFINEYAMSRPLVILIDNLDRRNETFKFFIRYISLVNNNLENTMILFTMNESKCDANFLRYIKNLKELNQYEEYKINYFDQYNTSKMIKSMLNTDGQINKLAAKIYSETLGNPQYISDVIKELYENKNLYFDEEIGEWRTEVKEKEILIPKTLEKRLEASLSLLNSLEISILKKLSIFESPLSEDIILKYIILNFSDGEVYKELKLKKILIDKISDQGILVGFANNLLRNILYLKLNEEERFRMHCKAAEFMEEILYETDYYIEEFLSQLEKSNNYEKAYFYTLKYAKAQEVLGNLEESILHYEKALKYPNNLGKSKIAIYIAKLYQKNSEHEKSYEYFEKANLFAIKNNEFEIQIYTMLEILIIKINDITDMDNGIDYSLKCVRRLLDIKLYTDGEILYHYVIALKDILEYDYDSAILNAKIAKDLCEEYLVKEDVYGWIIILLIGMYTKKKRYEEAERLCFYANEIFINNNNINGQLSGKLWYATISKYRGKTNEVILKQYLEICKLSKKHKVYKKEIVSLIYIANLYCQERKYIDAEKYLFATLERQEEEGIDSYSFNIYNELCALYIKSGEIGLAVRYYNLIKQMRKVLKLPEEQIISSNYTFALYNSIIYNHETAYKYMKEIYGSIFNSNNFYYKVMICEYFNLMIYKCNNEKDVRNVYDKLDNEIKLLHKIDIELEIRIIAIRKILLLGYKELAKELFLEIEGYSKDPNIEAMYIFLELNFREKSYYNFLINKALRVCVFANNQESKADLYFMIGKKYSELKCNGLAVNYYYEAIYLHIDIINSLPESSKSCYMNNSNFLKVRESYFNLLNRKLDIKIKFKEINYINRDEEINKVLMELDLDHMFKNKSMLKLAQEVYEKCYYNNFNDIFKVFEQFSNDTIKDIENVIKYMAKLTLADKAMLVTENSEDENHVICTYRISDKNEINRYFSLKFDSDEDVFIIFNNDKRLYQLGDKVLKDGMKACMYMKIVDREKPIIGTKRINARLILITNNAINYMNNESKEMMEKLKPFLIFLLEKYNLTKTSVLDKLTGIYNRKYIDEALVFLLDDERVEKSEFAVIMFDIDDFKGINDKYGHQTGDEALIKLVKEVEKCLGSKDIIGRYGGEEFIILCPSIDREMAFNKAERIRANVEDAKILGDKRAVTISVGIAMCSYESLLSSDDIIERADQALYRAKNEGKNRCILWKKECDVSVNISDELTGVISGTGTKEYKLALMLKDVATIIKNNGKKEDKIYSFLLKIMQVIECEIATVFILKDKKLLNKYSKMKMKDGFYQTEKFNFKLIKKVIEEKKGMYLIDWESTVNYDEYDMPEWKSICMIPIICNGKVVAVLYLSSSVTQKEFNYSDYNLLNCFAEVGTPIFCMSDELD